MVSIRHATVIRDGFHNGFTDLQFWKNIYWIAYRKGSGHATMDGTACISITQDRMRFQEVVKLKLDGDNRDPKLFPISGNRMAITIPSWQGGYKANDLKQFIAFSEDGFNWEKPVRILKDGQWLWRIRKHSGVHYGLIQELTPNKDGGLQHNLLLMTTENFLDWKLHCRIGSNNESLFESDLFFHENAEAWLVARSSVNPGYSYFGKATPPYTNWELTRLKSMIHAPIILKHGGKLYVSGRCSPEHEGIEEFPSKASLGFWELNEGKVDLRIFIPAMGDCSYPGLINDPKGRICLTYYSQHAYHMGTYQSPQLDQGCAPDDIYFAELQLP